MTRYGFAAFVDLQNSGDRLRVRRVVHIAKVYVSFIRFPLFYNDYLDPCPVIVTRFDQEAVKNDSTLHFYRLSLS